MARSERRGRRAAICVVLSMSILLAALIAALNSTGEQADAGKGEEVVPIDNSYRFRVYALNQTDRLADQNGTFFAFDEKDLPYRAETVRFGDYRIDVQFSSVYISGSGVLLAAAGECCTVAVREASGTPVIEFDYQGQDLVALAGEECYSSSLERLTHSGTNILVGDWLDGTWTPGQGIVVEHPSIVSFANATLFVMVFEPATVTAVPAYGAFPVLLCAVCLVLLLFRRGGGTLACLAASESRKRSSVSRQKAIP